ncbi:hypothetical protein ABH922_004444 [Rhodococcus sp. 27YEA15]|uniref:hypothetical protein n=1 Tax=Rhodococcus sp. 27YEA15 TaxID=3156259 RepID=UPI003C7D8749
MTIAPLTRPASQCLDEHVCLNARRQLASGRRRTYGDELLDFAIKWRHWSGPSAEDIFVTFGLPRHGYYNRLRQVVDGPAAAGLCGAMKANLLRHR